MNGGRRWQDADRHGREALCAALSAHLARAAVRPSPRRDAIVNVFLASKGNETVDEFGAHLSELGLRVAPTIVRDMLGLMAQWDDRPLTHCFGRLSSATGTLVCDASCVVEELGDEPLVEGALGAAACDHGFALDTHLLELHGRCDACRNSPLWGAC